MHVGLSVRYRALSVCVSGECIPAVLIAFRPDNEKRLNQQVNQCAAVHCARMVVFFLGCSFVCLLLSQYHYSNHCWKLQYGMTFVLKLIISLGKFLVNHGTFEFSLLYRLSVWSFRTHFNG